MRTIITLLFTASLIAPSACLAASPEDPCKSIGGLAASIMRNRQTGIEMSAQMAVAAKQPTKLADILRAMVILAYKEPQMLVPESQKSSVADFQNRVELACYERQQAEK